MAVRQNRDMTQQKPKPEQTHAKNPALERYCEANRALRERRLTNATARLEWLVEFSRSGSAASGTEAAIRAFLGSSGVQTRGEGLARSLTDAEISAAADTLRQGLSKLVDGFAWPINDDSVLTPGARGRPPYRLWRGPWQGCFLQCVAETIGQTGERLRRCARADCRQIFVRRKRGKYCSETCLQAERKRRFLSNHTKAQLKAIRRSYYEKLLEKSNPGAVHHRQKRQKKGGE
jgi:hypothetical protein